MTPSLENLALIRVRENFGHVQMAHTRGVKPWEAA
jgi:hypothetical protein